MLKKMRQKCSAYHIFSLPGELRQFFLSYLNLILNINHSMLILTSQEGETGSVYTNTLIYDGPKDDTVIIGRDATFRLPVTCSFRDRALASLRVRPQMSIVNGTLSGFGNLNNVTFGLQVGHVFFTNYA